MFEYPMEKYQFYYGPNKVVAVSTYEGKTVRGVAKCDPRDHYDVEMGKALAAARCNQKIALKRERRAKRERSRAVSAYDAAQRHLENMNEYFTDARMATYRANAQVEDLLKKM